MGDIADRLAAMPAEDRSYALRTLPAHLAGAGQADRLRQVLASRAFLEAKIAGFGTDAVLTDYDLAPDAAGLGPIRSAIRLAAHILDRDPDQLYSQLAARLDGIEGDTVQAFFAAAPPMPWASTATRSLALAGTPLLRTLAGHRDRVTSIVALPEGARFVSGSDDGTIIVRDAGSGAEVRRLGDPAPARDPASGVTALAVLPAGSGLIAGRRNGAVELHDIPTGEALGVLSTQPDAIGALALAPDGSRIVIATMRGHLSVLDAASGAVLHSADVEGGTVTAAALSGEGVAYNAGARIGVWFPATGEVHVLAPAEPYVMTLETLPDGRVLGACRDGFIRIWDLKERRVAVQVRVRSEAAVSGARALPDGRIAVATWDGHVQVRDASGGLERTVGSEAGQVRSVAVTRDGGLAITGGPDGSIRVWDLMSPAGPSRETRPSEHDRAVYRCISLDADRAVSLSHDGTLRVWSVDRAEELHTFHLHDPVTEPGGWLLATAGRNRIAAASRRGVVVSFRPEAGTTMERWDAHRVECTALAATRDGGRLVTAGLADGLKVWDARTGAERGAIEVESWGVRRTSRIRSIVCLADGRRAVAIFAEKQPHVFDLGSGELVGTLPGDVALHAHLEQDDSLLGLRRGEWLVLDPVGGDVLRTMPGPVDEVLGVSVATGSPNAATVFADGRVEVWRIADGSRICGFGADAEIQGCGISPDGRALVCGDRSGRMHFVRLVDGPAGKSSPARTGAAEAPWWRFWRRGG